MNKELDCRVITTQYMISCPLYTRATPCL